MRRHRNDQPDNNNMNGYGKSRGGADNRGGYNYDRVEGGGYSGYGNGGPSSRGNAVGETNRSLMEMENNSHINNLSNQVSMLKELTIDIGNEVSDQNRFLDGIGGSMFDASGMLGGTLKKINGMMARGGGRHMCYLVGFIVFAFLVIWWIMGKAKS